MKKQILWAGIAVTGLGLALAAPRITFLSLGVGAAAAGLVWLSRCRHSGRLGLLPPTTADDGTRTPAKWYCDACGRSWPTGLEHERTPVVRFSGYDQSKLPAAARRAAAHDKQRHSLAVKRAGLSANRAETAAAVHGNVTSINDRRAAR
jgi:hypothetical protein